MFLRIRKPRSSFKEKMAQMDWMYVHTLLYARESNIIASGNILLIGSTVAVLVALTWGGLRFAWTSANVLAPLIIGGIGLVVFFVIEILYIKNPMVRTTPSFWSSSHLDFIARGAFPMQVPKFCITNRTTLSGYVLVVASPKLLSDMNRQLPGDIFPWNSSDSTHL